MVQASTLRNRCFSGRGERSNVFAQRCGKVAAKPRNFPKDFVVAPGISPPEMLAFNRRLDLRIGVRQVSFCEFFSNRYGPHAILIDLALAAKNQCERFFFLFLKSEIVKFQFSGLKERKKASSESSWKTRSNIRPQ